MHRLVYDRDGQLYNLDPLCPLDSSLSLRCTSVLGATPNSGGTSIPCSVAITLRAQESLSVRRRARRSGRKGRTDRMRAKW